MLRPATSACGLSLAIALLAVPHDAAAHDPMPPQVGTISCVSTGGATCNTSDYVHVTGEGLDDTRVVVFMGGPGTRDDRRAKPRSSRFDLVTVRVPKNAQSGPVKLLSKSPGRSATTERIDIIRSTPQQSPAPSTQTPQGVFPVDGEHSYGSSANRFGGGRGHKGQDVLSSCSTPVVTAVAGTVSKVAYEGAAGNYAVIKTQDGSSHVYMHLLERASLSVDEVVTAGQVLGAVGQTGRATTCHLHFAVWTAPGWYEGGTAIDPLPLLQKWEGQ